MHTNIKTYQKAWHNFHLQNALEPSDTDTTSTNLTDLKSPSSNNSTFYPDIL